MSSLPPPPPPFQPYQMPYQTPQAYYRPPNPRPTSVTVLAILAIIFGGMGAAFGWVNVLPYVSPVMQNEVTRAFSSDPVMYAWTLFSTIWGWLISIVLLIAGIQCLKLRPLGRKLMMGYAWTSLAMALPATVMNFAYMMPTLQDLLAKNKGNPAVSAAVTGGFIGAIFGLLIGVAIVVYILYVMSRPHVKAAFASGGATPVNSLSPGQP
jgi:hypothetical protein